jgi:hypothetical protein
MVAHGLIWCQNQAWRYELPTLSAFYGIVVRMFAGEVGKHKLPHIHVVTSGDQAVVALDGTVLEGSIPASKMKLLLAWMEIHKEDLEMNWIMLSNNEPHYKIDPLK